MMIAFDPATSTVIPWGAAERAASQSIEVDSSRAAISATPFDAAASIEGAVLLVDGLT